MSVSKMQEHLIGKVRDPSSAFDEIEARDPLKKKSIQRVNMVIGQGAEEL